MDNLYSDEIYDVEPSSVKFEGVFSQMKKLNKKIRKLSPKKKGTQKGKKKQLKRRLKALELEHEQLKQFMSYAIYQSSHLTPQQPVWWQSAVTNSLPKAFELATAAVNKLPEKNRPLYITDGTDRK